MFEFKDAKTFSENFLDHLWDRISGVAGNSTVGDEQAGKLYADEGLVAFHGDMPVGALLWKLVTPADRSSGSFIGASLGVVPELRGRGLGSLLASQLKLIIEKNPYINTSIQAEDSDPVANYLASKLQLRARFKRLRYQLTLTQRLELPNHTYRIAIYDGQERKVVEEVAALYARAFRGQDSVGDLTPERFHDFSTQSSSVLLCLWDADRLAAFAGLNQHDSEGWIYWIAAGRRWWGKGVSDVLSSVIHNQLMDMGCTTADAQADENNYPSRALMERFGMTPIKTYVMYGSDVVRPVG